MFLEIEELSSGYGRLTTLRSVSLRVAAGTLVAVIGRNGAGKSTLLRALSGVQAAHSGAIRFGSIDISNASSSRRVEAGIVQVPEGRQIFGDLTIEENLIVGGYCQRKLIAGNLEKVYGLFPLLAERRRKTAGALSGGQQQMLALGRALMASPRLLLLDEPSMGLAPQTAYLVYEIIKKLQADNMTILLVEQNARAALRLADYAYVLETGTIVHEGTGRDLLQDDRVKSIYLGS